ncbi:hypothetical protein Y032_0003g1208 [Ancylostoma ceylanicum]|uniref:Uncharacterized protein n=1 Tax=Ancylostoma ceylanicum TaxID=53326 RepID=A0A016VWN6_9BILA|nr:hypothetical protein Y032_0003g1208 [Ancylostoma ceylanicum]
MYQYYVIFVSIASRRNILPKVQKSKAARRVRDAGDDVVSVNVGVTPRLRLVRRILFIVERPHTPHSTLACGEKQRRVL